MYTNIWATLPLPLTGRILGISGLKYFTGSPNYTPSKVIVSKNASLVEMHYPEADMRTIPHPDNSFDFIISDQVIEHIEGDVQSAIDETLRVLKPGGLVIITSVFMFPLHWGPKDFWRFSPDALRYLCRNFSEIITCDSWGNRFILMASLFYKKILDVKIPNTKKGIRHYLATRNETAYPSAVWVVAKK